MYPRQLPSNRTAQQIEFWKDHNPFPTREHYASCFFFYSGWFTTRLPPSAKCYCLAFTGAAARLRARARVFRMQIELSEQNDEEKKKRLLHNKNRSSSTVRTIFTGAGKSSFKEGGKRRWKLICSSSMMVTTAAKLDSKHPPITLIIAFPPLSGKFMGMITPKNVPLRTPHTSTHTHMHAHTSSEGTFIDSGDQDFIHLTIMLIKSLKDLRGVTSDEPLRSQRQERKGLTSWRQQAVPST